MNPYFKTGMASLSILVLPLYEFDRVGCHVLLKSYWLWLNLRWKEDIWEDKAPETEGSMHISIYTSEKQIEIGRKSGTCLISLANRMIDIYDNLFPGAKTTS